MVWLDNIDRFRPKLFENKEVLGTTLDEPTLIENSPKTSALDRINENSDSFGLTLDGVQITPTVDE